MVMKFGVEIEFYSPKDMNGTADVLRKKVRGVFSDSSIWKNWRIVRDGSLFELENFHAMELVSPILDTDKAASVRMLRKVCAVLQSMGCFVNGYCGLHVHVNASDLTAEQIKTVFHRYTKFEGVIDLMVPSNRRGSIYYSKCGDNIVDAVEDCQTTEALMRVQGDRYYKVNLCALQRHGTIEFRQHSGSINADTIMNWVSFITSFVEASKKVPTVRKRVSTNKRAGNGMPSGCKKVYDAFMASYRNGGGTLYLATIANRSGLALSSVKVAISKLKTDHGILIKKVAGERGAENPMYTITNPNASPRLKAPVTRRNAATSKPVVEDTVWRGIDKGLKAYYIERIEELSGFTVRNLPI